MGVFEHFPYTNYHELNISWILRKLKELEEVIGTQIVDLVARAGVAENAQAIADLTETVETVETTATSAEAAASAAQTSANNARAAASAAQTTADGATSAASAAQTSANTAQATANGAKFTLVGSGSTDTITLPSDWKTLLIIMSVSSNLYTESIMMRRDAMQTTTGNIFLRLGWYKAANDYVEGICQLTDATHVTGIEAILNGNSAISRTTFFYYVQTS